MKNRRDFLKLIGGATILTSASFLPLNLFGEDKDEKEIITILSTNDMHSRIDPFPLSDKKYGGMAGMARRASIVNAVREEGNSVLLVDAGDIFQGTPYYNVYKGALELELMSQMQYDAATIGNHEFDDGLGNLSLQIPKAAFPFICSNYDFSKTQMDGKTLRSKIFQKGNIKVGIYGLGIEPKGLISIKNYGDLIYNDPIDTANEMEFELKKEGCNLIIALSHLGYKYKSKKVSDQNIAENTKFTNLIIGGHTHTFLEKPDVVKNKENMNVIISQSGWGGINLGRTDFVFSKKFMQIVSHLNTTIFLKNQV